MNNNVITLEVLVNGKPIKEYKSPINLQTYIEGRDGNEFEIKVTNHSLGEVEAIISVDGLSIIDGKPAGNSSSGYLIKGKSFITIPGWKVNNGTAAKFTFSGKKGESYVEKIGEDANNKGVIGIKVFDKKIAIPKTPLWTNDQYTHPVWSSKGPMYASGSTLPAATQNPMLRSQSIGTGFGEATSFDTIEVSFERNNLISTMVLFYDDAAGLRKMGIDVKNKTSSPNPFPNDVGCKIPDGWGM